MMCTKPDGDKQFHREALELHRLREDPANWEEEDARFFVANYCPLVFYEESGRNRTPDSLRVAEKKPLLSACDLALRRTVEWLKPRYVVGIGGFAEGRAREALSGLHVTVGRISHPSPANPRANRGWAPLVRKELASMGIRV